MGQVELLNSYEKDGQDDLDNDKGEGLSILDVTSILVVTSFTFLPHLVNFFDVMRDLQFVNV